MAAQVRQMLVDGVDAEAQFDDDLLGGGVAGLSTADMRPTLEYVADRRMERLDLHVIHGYKNPLAFMELQDVQELSNFFERKVSAYQVGVSAVTPGAAPERRVSSRPTTSARSLLHSISWHLHGGYLSGSRHARLGRTPVKKDSLARPLAVLLAALSLVMAGLLGSPAAAGDHQKLTSAPSSGVAAHEHQAAARRSDSWVNRMHPTANNERVDLRDDRIDKVWNLHKVNFTALVRVVEWARSPRKSTSPDGIDRGVYEYRIYEYVYENGDLKKTGRWVVIRFVIEWGDGVANRGWMVTAYPVSTNSGAPPKDAAGKTYCPAWLASSAVMGPVNNDILY